MSELTQKLKNQGWTNSCDCQHALHLHCHNQILESAETPPGEHVYLFYKNQPTQKIYLRILKNRTNIQQ